MCAFAPTAGAAATAYFTDSGVISVGNPQSLGGTNNTGQSVAFVVTFDYTSEVASPSVPIVLWEMGATGSGSALVLEGNELHFFAGDGSDDVVTALHGLSVGTPGVQIVSVFEIGAGANGTDERLSLYVNGGPAPIATGDFATANIWAGSDSGAIGSISGNAGARFSNGSPPFNAADVINFPNNNISLSVYRLASSGGPVENTIGNILIPEPSTMCLFGLGSVVLIRRRR